MASDQLDPGEVEHRHVSIIKSLDELRDVKCESQDCACRSTSKVHCKLCTPDHFTLTYPRKLEAHLISHHWKKRYKFGEWYVVQCQLSCKPIPHFHCPRCGGAYVGFSRVHTHVSQCSGSQLRSGLIATSSPITGHLIGHRQTKPKFVFQGWDSDEEDHSLPQHPRDKEANSKAGDDYDEPLQPAEPLEPAEQGIASKSPSNVAHLPEQIFTTEELQAQQGALITHTVEHSFSGESCVEVFEAGDIAEGDGPETILLQLASGGATIQPQQATSQQAQQGTGQQAQQGVTRQGVNQQGVNQQGVNQQAQQVVNQQAQPDVMSQKVHNLEQEHQISNKQDKNQVTAGEVNRKDAQTKTKLTRDQRIEKVKQQIGQFYHKSMLLCLPDLEVQACEECRMFHCPLCPTSIWSPAPLRKLQMHMSAQHWRYRYQYEGVSIVRCVLPCQADGATSTMVPCETHWHCPLCTCTFANRSRLRSHMAAHAKGRARAEELSALLKPVWYVDELVRGVPLPPELGGLLGQQEERNLGWDTGDGHDDVTFTDEEIKAESKPEKVFQVVAALLVPEMLAMIPGSKEGFLETLQETTRVQCTLTSDKYCLLQGEWGEVSQAQYLLDSIRTSEPHTAEDLNSIMTAKLPGSPGLPTLLPSAGNATRDSLGTGSAAGNHTAEDTTRHAASKPQELPATSSSGMLNEEQSKSKRGRGRPRKQILAPSVEEDGAKSNLDGTLSGQPSGIRDTTDEIAGGKKAAPRKRGRPSKRLSDLGQEGASEKEKNQKPIKQTENMSKDKSSGLSRTDLGMDVSKERLVIRTRRQRQAEYNAKVSPSKSDQKGTKTVPETVTVGKDKDKEETISLDSEAAKSDPNIPDITVEETVQDADIESPAGDRVNLEAGVDRASTVTSQHEVDISDDDEEAGIEEETDDEADKRTREEGPDQLPPSAKKRTADEARKRKKEEDTGELPSSGKKRIAGDEARKRKKEEGTDQLPPSAKKRIADAESEEPVLMDVEDRGKNKEQISEVNIKQEAMFSCEEEAGDCVLKLTLPILESNIKSEPFDVVAESEKQTLELTEEDYFIMDGDVAQAISEANIAGEVTFTEEELVKLTKKRKALQICPKCKKVFTSRDKLFNHIFLNTCKALNHLNKMPPKLREIVTDTREKVTDVQCPLCEKKFSRNMNACIHYALKVCQKDTLNNDVGLIKTQDGVYQCRYCDYCDPKPGHVKTHEARLHFEKSHECPVCHKCYGTRALLKTHIRYVHMKQNVPKVTCHTCGKEVLSKHFSQHFKRYHDPNYVKPKYKALDHYVTCPMEGCSYQTRHMPDFRKHVKKVHGEKDRKCDECGEEFHLGTELTMHRRIKHGIDIESLQTTCPHCQKKLLKKNLKNHIKLVHDKVKEFMCPICGVEMQTKHTLSVHIERHKPVSERRAKYLCAECGKGFLNKTAYMDHTNVHTGVRPYLCNQCGKSFKQMSAYGKHLELHKGMKHFCDQCGSSFALQKYLTQHKKRVHEQVHTRFVCACSKEFQSYANLCSHRAGCTMWQEQQTRELEEAPESNVDVETSAEQATFYLQSEEGDQLFQAVQESAEDGQQHTLVVLETVNQDTEPSAIEDGVISIVPGDDPAQMQFITMDTDHIDPNELSEDHTGATSMDRYLCGYCQQLFVSLQVVQEHMLQEHMKDIPQVEGSQVELSLHMKE